MAVQVHNFFSHLQFFYVGEIMKANNGHLMLPGAFPDKVTGDIDFKAEA